MPWTNRGQYCAYCTSYLSSGNLSRHLETCARFDGRFSVDRAKEALEHLQIVNRGLESRVGNEGWKREDTIISRLARFLPFFGAFSAGSKTTLSCAYPLTEVHRTRFLGLLQVIPPESSVRNGKIPVLADYSNFAPWSNFWHFFGRLQDDDVLRLPLARIVPNSVSCAFAGHSI